MQQHDTFDLLAERIAQLNLWLEGSAPYAAFDQRHLDQGTPEQAYWHSGYRAALLDAQHIIEQQTANQSDNIASSPQASPEEGTF